MTASIAALSQEAKLAAFGDMLAASKLMKVLEAKGERVRDVQPLKDIARPAQSAAGQSGSERQKNKIEAREIWDEYVIVVDKEPLAASSNTNPLLVNLTDVIGQDGIEAFGDELVVQIGKLTSWKPRIVGDSKIEGHASAIEIRELISSSVSEVLGPKPTNKDLPEMVRRIQARDAQWRIKKRSEFPGPTKSARNDQYTSYVRNSYKALVKEKQRTFIETLPLIERVCVVVHVLLTWYANRKKYNADRGFAI